ncbi:MAG: glyoxalase [Gammaproteobacteria bacterium]|nr:glyoxalase [Gammaproteobacteria bacterium]
MKDDQVIFPFHVAVPVNNLKRALEFYQNHFDVEVGRRSEQWVDLNLYGHQFVLHLDEQHEARQHINKVDGKQVPVPHYGVILSMPEWRKLAEKLTFQQVEFVIEPYIRFEGQPGEQGTLFLLDPSGNALEFKGFEDFSQIFAS